MVATPIEDLVETVAAAFAAERTERDEVIGWKSQTPESAARVDAVVRSAVLKATQHPEAWDKYIHFGADHYVRNLVFANEDFELLVVCWSKGQGSRIHNHGPSHGWVTVLQGRVEEARFDNPRAGLHDDSVPTSPAEGPAVPPALPGVLAAVTPCPPLRPLGKGVAGPGAQLYINDGQALHAVRCADDTDCEQGAVTVHLYAPPTRKVWLYEPGENRIVQRVPGYHTKAGVPVREQA